METGRIRLSSNSPVMTVTVGGHGQSSSVEVGAEVLVEAFPGQNSQSDHTGGDGYCGGGGKGYDGRGGRGGSDGADGEQTVGGHGSGLQIGQLSTEHFQLTPGEGGQANIGAGGGGGGVIVNGMMPGDNLYIGKGYGGGDSWNGDLKEGYPGCVMFEN